MLCILHIGLEKTGSSQIQDFLSINRDALKKKGILYPHAGGYEGSQIGYVAVSMDDPINSDISLFLDLHSNKEIEQYAKKLRLDLMNELENLPDCHLLLLSSEHFHSRLTTLNEISALKRFLSAVVSKFKIIFYVRRQDRVAVSRFSTKLRGGERDGVLGFDYGGEYYYSYDKIFENWAQVFGLENVHVSLFDSNEFKHSDLVYDFCEKVGINGGAMIHPNVRSNVSLNENGAHLMECVSHIIPAWVNRKRNAIFWRISEFIYRNYQGHNYPITREEAKHFCFQFYESNKRLKSLAFPGRDIPLFNEDFEDYPVARKISALGFEEAASLLVRYAEEQEELVTQLRAHLKEFEVKAEQAEARVESSEKSAPALQAELEAARQELHNLHQSNHHRWQIAEARQLELQSILNSKSWRMTSPLRLLNNALRQVTSIMIKDKFKLLLQHAALYVGRRPRLKSICLQVLERFPSLKFRLLNLRGPLHTLLAIQQHSNCAETSANLSELSPRARQIYVDLKFAIEQQEKKHSCE